MGQYIIGKRILITGGTGSLGCALISRLPPIWEFERVIVFFEDEQKQNELELASVMTVLCGSLVMFAIAIVSAWRYMEWTPLFAPLH